MNPDAPAKLEIERTLRQRSRFVRLTPALRAHYRAQRDTEFLRLVELWSPLLLLAFAGCLAFAVFFHRSALTGPDLTIYTRTEVLALVMGSLGLGLVRHPRWRVNSEGWIPWAFGFIMAVKIHSSFQFGSVRLAHNQAYMTLIVLLIGTLALQQSLWASVQGILIGLVTFAGTLASRQMDDFAWIFLGQYALAASVCLFVSFIREDRDRVAFLQSCLLHLEKQEVHRLAGELAQQVSRDSLTGLYNRRHLEETLRTEWDRARRNRAELSLLMIDVDHFKQFNDHHGHPAGDQCLREIARLISGIAQRPADMAARLGGEEFVVLLPDTGLEGALARAHALLQQIDAVALPHQASPTAAWVTISIGVASCQATSPLVREDLMEAADRALYTAKRQGRRSAAIEPVTPRRQYGS
jgi:diguanylate cyclase (GGDEF)-like protein